MKIGLVSYYVRNPEEAVDEGEDVRIRESREVVLEVADLLEQRGVDYAANPNTAEELGCDSAPLSEMDRMDAVVTVGGDGTILRTVAAMRDPSPILGVNTGRVGFLAAVDPDDAVVEVDALFDGFDTEERTRMAVEVEGERVGTALNEAVLVTSRPAKIMEFDVYQDGVKVESVRSDGLVTATATGSTAYSMSAGGPLVDPCLDVFLVVPLSPFHRRAYTWVLDSNNLVEVEPTRVDRQADVVVDGSEACSVGRGDVVGFSEADKPALFVKTGDGFFHRVRDKLV